VPLRRERQAHRVRLPAGRFSGVHLCGSACVPQDRVFRGWK
jgi:hypothetical protein